MFANIAVRLQPSRVPSRLCSELPRDTQWQTRLLNSTEEIALCDEFKGKTLLVVTPPQPMWLPPQFEQLEQLHQTYKDQDFTVMGFPSNDFSPRQRKWRRRQGLFASTAAWPSGGDYHQEFVRNPPVEYNNNWNNTKWNFYNSQSVSQSSPHT